MPLIPDYYCKWECIACGTRQRVYIGDPQDYSKSDIDVVRCFHCKNLELIGDASDFCYAYGIVDGNGYPQEITQDLLREYAYIGDGEKL